MNAKEGKIMIIKLLMGIALIIGATMLMPGSIFYVLLGAETGRQTAGIIMFLVGIGLCIWYVSDVG